MVSVGCQDVLKAPAIIANKNYFLRYAQNPENAMRGNEALPETADDFINDRTNGRLNRVQKQVGMAMRNAFARPDVQYQTSLWLADCARTNNRPEIIEQFVPEEGRLNAAAFGEAFEGQITSVVPFYLTEPTRGIAFDFIPKISQGGMAGKDIKVQAYSGRQGLFQPYGENFTQISTIEVEGKEIKVNIASLAKGVEIGVKEMAFVAEYNSMSKYPNFNPQTGIVNPVMVKLDYLDKYYKLTHDSIAFYGSYNPEVQDTSLGLMNILTTTDIPTYTVSGGTTFSDMTTDEKSNLLVDFGNKIMRQSLSNMYADTLFIDLFSFTKLMTGYSQYKDTVTLNNLIANGQFKAIIPVAAWSQIAPTQTTMIAVNNNRSVWFYNLALPLTSLNPELKNTELTLAHVTRTSGVTVNNSLGIARLTMPLGDSDEMLFLVKQAGKRGRPALNK
jgi:hypothetical protein